MCDILDRRMDITMWMGGGLEVQVWRDKRGSKTPADWARYHPTPATAYRLENFVNGILDRRTRDDNASVQVLVSPGYLTIRVESEKVL